MSHSGSSEYPLPLTGPIPKPEFSSTSIQPHLQNSIEFNHGAVNSSTSRRLPTSSSQNSLKIYSVKTHQRHKKPSLASTGDNTETSLSNINNNNNFQLEKEVRFFMNNYIGKNLYCQDFLKYYFSYRKRQKRSLGPYYTRLQL